MRSGPVLTLWKRGAVQARQSELQRTDLCSGGVQFESCSGHWPPEFFVIFFIPSRLIPAFRLGFMPRPLPSTPFLIYRPSSNETYINIHSASDNTLLLVSESRPRCQGSYSNQEFYSVSGTRCGREFVFTVHCVLCEVWAVHSALPFSRLKLFSRVDDSICSCNALTCWRVKWSHRQTPCPATGCVLSALLLRWGKPLDDLA